MRRSILALIGAVVFAANAHAQTHYNRYEFGARSALLGGAVVGGVRDTSAAFYNPGALGFITNPSLSVSGNLYEYSSLSLENGAGTGEDLESDNIQAVPLLLSGIYLPEGLPNHAFGYSLLTREKDSLKFNGRSFEPRNVLDDSYSPGVEDFLGTFDAQSDVTEIWGGLSYAYKVNENISIGATVFAAVRDDEAQEVRLARAVNPDTLDVTTVDFLRSYEYYDVRVLAKAGIAADYDPLRLGLVFTTPSANLFGEGDVAADFTVTNLNFDGTGFVSFAGSDRQEGIDSDYKTPFSVAAGAEYTMASTIIAVSAEYFTDKDAYDILEPETRPFFRPVGIADQFSLRDLLTVSSENDEVVNVAVGIEQKLNDKWSAVASFRTDQAYSGSYDLYHVTAGALYRAEKYELAAGLAYGFARDDGFAQPVNFATAADENLLIGEPETQDVDYNSVSVLLGYTYYF